MKYTDLGHPPEADRGTGSKKAKDPITSSSKTSSVVTLSSEVTHAADRGASQQEGPPIIAHPSANLNLQNVEPATSVDMPVYDLPNWLASDLRPLNHKQAS